MAETFSTDVYEGYNLYTDSDKFYIEPTDTNGTLLSPLYLEIDRHSCAISVNDSRVKRIPILNAKIKFIYGLLGTIKLISGHALVVISKAKIVGKLNGNNVWVIQDTETLPYKSSTMHLTETQVKHNRMFTEMLSYVLSIGGFYYSTSLDLSRTFQWLHENATPAFRTTSMIDRASERFVWNGHLLKDLRSVAGADRFLLPVIHGFFGQQRFNVNGNSFKMTILSRRSIFRAGVRFHKRGVDTEGHAANFVETEQIVEAEVSSGKVPTNAGKRLTSFVILRGSIPLLWSQKPNLRWQPLPIMKPTDDQLAAYHRSFAWHKKHYGGKHVIVNLVNQKGSEKRVGSELERVAQQANLDFVRYHPFDFHKECHAMQWHRLSKLKEQLIPEIEQFGYFSSIPGQPEATNFQGGFFRINCMDCLDRTNVVQSMLARESLTQQLRVLGILSANEAVENVPQLETAFKHMWADNGDECSRQYAGTGALKADFTRLGRRTYMGAMQDGANAITRYFRNNFGDGYRQDSIDFFLGNYVVDLQNIPTSLDDSLFNGNQNGLALMAALFAMAMTVLCILVADNLTATAFWLFVFLICLSFIFLNGEEFVNAPKLKVD